MKKLFSVIGYTMSLFAPFACSSTRLRTEADLLSTLEGPNITGASTASGYVIIDFGDPTITYITTGGLASEAPGVGDEGLADAIICYDAHRKRCILYAITADQSPTSLTLEWSGVSWKLLDRGGIPPRAKAAFAYDQTTGQAILFGGVVGISGKWSETNETWAWNGQAWTMQSTEGPVAREAARIVSCDDGRLFLFGGLTTSLEQTGRSKELSDMWEWTNGRWTQVHASKLPPPRHSHSMSYDGASGSIVLFGGVSNGRFLGDTWTYTNSEWKERPTSTSPPPGAKHLMLNTDDHGVLLLGGWDPRSCRGAWHYLNLEWTRVK